MILNFITFASNKYKKQADVLLDSIATFHKDSQVFFYDLGENNSPYIPTLAKVRLEKILKLFEKGLENIVLLGADCELFKPLTEMETLLRTSNIVLIPHILEWVPEDGKMPSNKDFYMTGHCNADVIGFRNTPTTIHILKELIKLPMIDDKHNGVFYEQTWLSALPFMYTGVEVLKHPGYNIAYFNIFQRHFKYRGGKYFTGSQQLAIMQYSGFDASHPEKVSKFQNRYIASGDILKVYKAYAAKIN